MAVRTVARAVRGKPLRGSGLCRRVSVTPRAPSEGQTSAGAQGRAGEEESDELCPEEETAEGEASHTQTGPGGDDAVEGPDQERPEEPCCAKPAHAPGAPARAEYERHELTRVHGAHGAAQDVDVPRTTGA